MKKVIFIGSKELGFSVFRKLHQLDTTSLQACITFDDRTDSRSYYDDFKRYCFEKKISLYVLNKAQEIGQIIFNLKPDLCFVLGWYFLIEKKVVDSVPMGFIGIHNSLLPKYRGFAPLVWTIINGEKEAGFSLFNFSEEMDAGEIWAFGKVIIDPDDYVSDVINKINKEILTVLDEKYLQILNEKIAPYKQQNILPSYCAKRIPSDGVINWHLPLSRVYDFIRAQSHPYPGAYTIYRGKKLIIWRAQPYKFTCYGTPGQVAQIFDDGVLVICGDSRGIVLKEIEYEGETVIASKILNSLDIRMD